ncbi:uncharacterized protein SPSC_02545 [Sporisorium scitamineum]|uniref:Uncharacterized protein n=1 Tax=Sporisorium scitamineum TaxID=49012 RepID=A0A0F7RY14_9BASI|nr:hypothetical protein [Sporisorium scitamineum]CDU23916.1 uncharacterized protein SPSC_02545 [Sporisorium scitamineum]
MSSPSPSPRPEATRADLPHQPNPTNPPLDPSSQFAKDLHALVDRLKTQPLEDLARRRAFNASLSLLLQARSFTSQASFILTHPIETRMGTCTVGNALIHTGVIWTLCCRSEWIAKASTEWMAFSSAPVRRLVFVGAATLYFNPPVQKWDARFYGHKVGRFVKGLNESFKS